jgi:hypothetical protein
VTWPDAGDVLGAAVAREVRVAEPSPAPSHLAIRCALEKRLGRVLTEGESVRVNVYWRLFTSEADAGLLAWMQEIQP